MSRKRFKRLLSTQYEKDWTNGYRCDFRVNYDAIVVNDILVIYKYLMKKHDINECLDCLLQ